MKNVLIKEAKKIIGERLAIQFVPVMVNFVNTGLAIVQYEMIGHEQRRLKMDETEVMRQKIQEL